MISGLVRVRLDTRVPVISDVLTPQNFHEHDEHKKFFYDHFVVKGAEAAAAVQQRSTRSRVCNRRLDAQGKPQNRRGSARKSCRRSRSGNGLGGGLRSCNAAMGLALATSATGYPITVAVWALVKLRSSPFISASHSPGQSPSGMPLLSRPHVWADRRTTTQRRKY